MKLLTILLILAAVLILLNRALGQHQQHKTFMENYKEAIQKYIMTGHELRGQHCDILSANPSYNSVPQISMDLEKIKTLNMKSAFASSHCLLVNYHITNEASLSALTDFGWEAIEHIRLALIIKMESGITLSMVRNATKMPFLVAAELDHGQEFLCPVVGEIEPRLEHDLCKASYVSYKNKRLRIGLVGPMPDFIYRDGTIEGTGIRLIDMLASRLNFIPQVQVPNSMDAAESLVGPK